MWFDFVPFVSLLSHFLANNLSSRNGNYLEKLDLQGLLNVSETNNILSPLAIEVFRRKYSQYSIDIHRNVILKSNCNTTGSMTTEKFQHFQIFTDEQIILAHDLNVYLKLIKHFGSVIRRTKISNQNFHPNEEDIMAQHLNKYCNQSLAELNIEITRHNMLKQLEGPFKNVHNFTCSIIEWYMHDIQVNKNRTLNDLFPNLHRLTLSLDSRAKMHFVGHLPHLERLSLKSDTLTYGKEYRGDTKHTEHLLSKNAHVRDLELIFYPHDFAKVVNRLLPGLQKLTLWNFDMGYDSVHFEHVKSLTLLSSIDGSPTKMTFTSLQELDMKYESEYGDAWVEFFRQNKQLKRIFIEKFNAYAYNFHTKFEQLITELPNIVDMTILIDQPISAKSLVRFIEGHSHLMRFKHGCTQFPQLEIDELKKHLAKDWSISEFKGDYNGLTFERKKRN